MIREKPKIFIYCNITITSMKVKTTNSISGIKKIIKEFWKKEINVSKVKKITIKQIWVYLEDKNEIIGFINGYIINFGFCKSAFLINFQIKKKYRRQGLSTKLMDKFMSYCKKQKVQEIELRVGIKNDIAKKLYKKYKFKEDKTGILMNRYFK